MKKFDPLVLGSGLAAAAAIGMAALAQQRGSRSGWEAAEPTVSADIEDGGWPDPDDGVGARGRLADTPLDIPARGWRDVAVRVYGEITEDRVLAVAAGVTFYALLALFPAIVALVSLYGLTADLGSLAQHLDSFRGVAPRAALDFVGDQVARVVSKSDGALSFAFIFGLLTALWSANAGVKAMFDALNVVYEEREKRSFVVLNLTSLAFTIGSIAFLLAAFNAVVVLPVALTFVWLGGLTETLISLGRWPVLFATLIFALTLLYRFGPSRRSPKWRWAAPGSAAAAAVWVLGSLAFSWYAENLAHFDKTYGSLGAAVGFMLWMWMSVIVVLLGGELNAEMERQTAEDTTRGCDRPMGARGARVADTVAVKR